ncbi:MAG: hypothetical protein J6031_01245 [Bacteroidales bacterium]|nr:hypothetical protein [Bacteroidales bacterium]
MNGRYFDVAKNPVVADLRSATSSTLNPQITHLVPADSIVSATGPVWVCSVISTIV